MSHAFLFDAVRSPRGRGRADGSLHLVRPVDLLAAVLAALQARTGLDPALVDDVVAGCVTQTGEQGACIARFAALQAGWPETIPGVTHNRFCGSGLEAVNHAAAMVAAGYQRLVVAGGVECMSRVKMGADGGAWWDAATQWSIGAVPQGISADLLATIHGFSREDLDAFALESQRRVAVAQASGAFDRGLTPIRDGAGLTLLDRDEYPRPETTAEALGRALAFSRRLKKTPILVGDGFGFYTTRVFAAYILEGAELVAEGHDPAALEWAARTAGMAVPPLQVFDEISLTLGKHVVTGSRPYLGDRFDTAGAALVLRMVDEAGRAGRAAGAGFYDYVEGKRQGLWAGLKGLVSAPARPVDVEALRFRLLAVQAAEVARVLDAGILRRSRDAELGAVLGLGFAPPSGGPLAWMDRQGLPALVAHLDDLAARHGPRYAPCTLLRELAARGGRFYPA